MVENISLQEIYQEIANAMEVSGKGKLNPNVALGIVLFDKNMSFNLKENRSKIKKFISKTDGAYIILQRVKKVDGEPQIQAEIEVQVIDGVAHLLHVTTFEYDKYGRTLKEIINSYLNSNQISKEPIQYQVIDRSRGYRDTTRMEFYAGESGSIKMKYDKEYWLNGNRNEWLRTEMEKEAGDKVNFLEYRINGRSMLRTAGNMTYIRALPWVAKLYKQLNPKVLLVKTY